MPPLLDCHSSSLPSALHSSAPNTELPSWDHVLNMSPKPSPHLNPQLHADRILVDDESSPCLHPQEEHCFHSAPSILSNNPPTSKSSMELMKEIAILEVEIMRMERYLLSLYRAAFQQHIPDLLGKHAANIESKINTPLHSTVDDPNYNFEFGMSKVYVDKYDRSSSPSALVCSDDQLESATKSSSRREKNADSGHRSLADHLGVSRIDDFINYPDRLSEEIVRCIASIYCKLANPSTVTQKGSSVSSTSSMSSSSTFSPRNLSGSWSLAVEEGTEQCEYEGFKDDKKANGTPIEVLKVSLDDDSFTYATTMLQNFRLLVKSLEKVDPMKLKREEKLVFWINIHNALVMHAYLAYGTQNCVRTSSILRAAYNVGGHCINAYVIQNSILGIRPHYSAPWLQTLLSPGKKLVAGGAKHAYAIEYPEPLVHFALSLGASSDPAIRVYTARNVFRDLKVAKKEFIEATVCIQKETAKIYVPKIVCYYAKDMSFSMDGLVEDMNGCLSESQQKAVKSCVKGRPEKYIDWLPQSSSFRYLIHCTEKLPKEE
nr:uncharacterized protein LOC109166066 [Ipomoea batatas]